jgi:hypothetical protein
VIDAVAADCEDVQHGGALPSALTVIAAELGRTSAKLVAVVNPGGSATTVHFEFGTDLRYGSRTESRPIGSGVDDVVVTIVASGLKPGTTYHFRAVATSSEGTSLGDDASFATAKAARACVVPRLRGRSLVAARAMLIRSGCRLGSIRRIRAREKPGTVVGQRPRAGARLRPGARVSVIVSR